MFLSGVVAEGAGANVPTLNFWVIGKFSTRQKIFLQKCKIWDEKPHVGEIKRQKRNFEHPQSTLPEMRTCLSEFCGGWIWSVYRETATFNPAYFLAHDAAVVSTDIIHSLTLLDIVIYLTRNLS